jgi:hypothetical protein
MSIQEFVELFPCNFYEKDINFSLFHFLSRHKPLFSHLVPKDNASQENMNIGCYHFRLWNLGKFYDVVIDNLLLVNQKNELILTRRSNYRDVFWVGLFEKALAK